ncbi:TetR/AcrR family transcriptional regulator [Jatrophihabitans sp. YIM 134969]
MTQTDTAPAAGPPKGAAATRERILAAASELFYADGLHAVSADRIIEKAGITKVTFYRHFRTKDELLVAYLERRAAFEREAVTGGRAATAGDPVSVFDALAAGIGEMSCQPGFRGCPFINAAAEYSDPDHPVREVVDRHRRWFLAELADMLRDVGVDDVDSAAVEAMLLRDGAMVTGYLGDPSTVSSALARGFHAVIDAHRGPGARAPRRRASTR